MNSRFVFSSLIIFTSIFFIQSCNDDDLGENETLISRYNEDESHNAGQNCMNCHFQGGSGEGWFNIAGTVYDSLEAAVYPNATIRFYTGPAGSGSLKYTLEVDALGNFFTTEDIDFGDELFTSVEGNSAEQFMISPVSMGECNSCHGNSVESIWAK
jgi:hypothetical protein